jgi:hypothetical protein
MTCPPLMARALDHQAAASSRGLPDARRVRGKWRRWRVVRGNDWAEDHHDVEVQDQTGRRLGKARVPEGVVGIAGLHELMAGDSALVEGIKIAARTHQNLI